MRLNWRRDDSGTYIKKAFKRKYKMLKQIPWGCFGVLLRHLEEQVRQHLSGITFVQFNLPWETRRNLTNYWAPFLAWFLWLKLVKSILPRIRVFRVKIHKLKVKWSWLLFTFIDNTLQSFHRNFRLFCSYRLCLKLIKTSNSR